MKQYDPNITPDPASWLALDEAARIDLVLDYHADSGLEIDNERVHATLHVVVENQVALAEVSVPATVERLLRQGLDRHEAVHAIGAVLLGDMHLLLKSEREQFDLHRYRSRLNKLTAKKWRTGKY